MIKTLRFTEGSREIIRRSARLNGAVSCLCRFLHSMTCQTCHDRKTQELPIFLTAYECFAFHITTESFDISCTAITQPCDQQLFKCNTYRIKKWNESGFRPPLCTYRLNWARRTSWGWWDDWDDTVLQTQNSKFEPWRSEAEHATSRSRRLPAILTFTRGWGRNIFVSFKPPSPGTESRTLAWKAAVLTTTLGPRPRIG